MSDYLERLRADGIDLDEFGRPTLARHRSAQTWEDIEARDETNKSDAQRQQMRAARQNEAWSQLADAGKETGAWVHLELIAALISQAPCAKRDRLAKALQQYRPGRPSGALEPVVAVALHIERAHRDDLDTLITIIELLSSGELLVEHLLDDIERRQRAAIETERMQRKSQLKLKRDEAERAKWQVTAKEFRKKYRVALSKGIILEDPHGYLTPKE